MASPRIPRPHRALIATLLIGATALAGCGGETPSGTPGPPTTLAAGATTAASTTTMVTGVHVADSKLGPILVDGRGRTLYGFTKDTDGKPTCSGGCLNAWPPLIVEGTTLPAGLDPAVFSLVTGTEGQPQLKAGAWPLYLYAADTAPGDVKGQGSGGVWFVVNGQGQLNRSTGATTTTTAAAGGAYSY
jgi:predicted lipoprotein with Yx(FWY)xxD motif